jgi:hypothetical protein
MNIQRVCIYFETFCIYGRACIYLYKDMLSGPSGRPVSGTGLAHWECVPFPRTAWFVSVLCCPVSVQALRRADPPSKMSYQFLKLFITSESILNWNMSQDLIRIILWGERRQHLTIYDQQLLPSGYWRRRQIWSSKRFFVFLTTSHGC